MLPLYPPALPADWLSPTLHPVYTRLICAELRRRGIPEERILEGTRLSWATLHEGSRFLSLDEASRLIRRAVSLTQEPWIGVTVGWGTQLSAHGAVGVAAMSCDNIGQALLVIQRFAGLRQRIMGIELHEQGDEVALVICERIHAPDIREYLMGHLVGAGLRLLETLSGLDIVQWVRVELDMLEPTWADAYRRLAPSVRFGAHRSALVLPKSLLLSPGLAPDHQAHLLALRDCERQWVQHNDARDRQGLASDRLLRLLLACEGAYPSLEDMAAREHVSSRTLMRKLREEGVSYQQLLDRVREDQACWCLLHTDLTVEAIAERLGYQDTSNFSRTFRRWVGVNPRDFRAGLMS